MTCSGSGPQLSSTTEETSQIPTYAPRHLGDHHQYGAPPIPQTNDSYPHFSFDLQDAVLPCQYGNGLASSNAYRRYEQGADFGTVLSTSESVSQNAGLWPANSFCSTSLYSQHYFQSLGQDTQYISLIPMSSNSEHTISSDCAANGQNLSIQGIEPGSALPLFDLEFSFNRHAQSDPSDPSDPSIYNALSSPEGLSLPSELTRPPAVERLSPNLFAATLGIPNETEGSFTDSPYPNANSALGSSSNILSPYCSDASSSVTLHNCTPPASFEVLASGRLLGQEIPGFLGYPDAQLRHRASMDSFAGDSENIPLVNTPGKQSAFAAPWSLMLLPPPPGFSDFQNVKGLNKPWEAFPVPCQSALQEALHAEFELKIKMTELEAGNIAANKLPKASVKRRRVDQVTEKTQSPWTMEDSEQIHKSETREKASRVIVKEYTTTKKVQPDKVGKRKSERGRSTAIVREKGGACLRCWFYGEKCSSGKPCERCIALAGKLRTWKIPCMRARLDDIELFRRRTQFGLFLYTYVQQPAELPIRTVKIIDPSDILRNESRSDLTSKQEFALESTPFHYLDPYYTNRVDVAAASVLRDWESRELQRREVINDYLGMHMETVIEVLGTSHKFVAETLRTALCYSKPKRGQSTSRSMLCNALRLFTARFLRRKYWISAEGDHRSYSIAWMDAPWRALPTAPPRSSEEAKRLNKILKDYLFGIEKEILEGFTRKIQTHKREDWFELFLVTFIFQVILSENLEMSFHSRVDGFEEFFELPWSSFGGLRSYSSRKTAAYFKAINGTDPFRQTRQRGENTPLWDGFGDIERKYLDKCSTILKESMENKEDLGSRRSSSAGHGGSPGSWWQWALETVLGTDLAD